MQVISVVLCVSSLAVSVCVCVHASVCVCVCVRTHLCASVFWFELIVNPIASKFGYLFLRKANGNKDVLHNTLHQPKPETANTVISVIWIVVSKPERQD